MRDFKLKLCANAFWQSGMMILDDFQAKQLREGCRKSKWKFKMAFAMKGGGLEGVSFAIKLF